MQDSKNIKLMLCTLLKRMNMGGQKNEMKFIILWKILFAKIKPPVITLNSLPD